MEHSTAKPQHTYAYFERSFNIELLLFMLFGPILVSLWTIVVYYFQYSGRLPIPLVKSAVYFTTTSIFAVIFYNNARTLSKTKSIIVEKDRVIKKSLRGICYVRYTDISSIRLPKFPLLKRWITLETSQNKTLAIPLRVRSGQEMVEGIFRNMHESGTFLENSGAMMERIGTISRRVGILYDLRDKNMPNIIRAITVTAFLYGMVSILYWDRGLITAVPFGMAGMFLQAAAYFAAERFHMNALLRDGGKVWDDADESGNDGGASTDNDMNAGTGGSTYRGYYLITGLAALLAGMVIGIIITYPI